MLHDFFMMRELIKERFKEQLKNKGIDTAAELQRLIGSNHTTANNYFKGKSLPPLDIIALLDKKIGIDVNKLIR